MHLLLPSPTPVLCLNVGRSSSKVTTFGAIDHAPQEHLVHKIIFFLYIHMTNVVYCNFSLLVQKQKCGCMRQSSPYNKFDCYTFKVHFMLWMKNEENWDIWSLEVSHLPENHTISFYNFLCSENIYTNIKSLHSEVK